MRLHRTLFLAGVLLAPAILCAAYPAARGPVNDDAGVLDENARGGLTALLLELEQKAGAQLAVAVVKSLEGKDVETYANELYAFWGIGDKKTDRGALILVAIEDRKTRIETGYGLEGILPDGLCGAIIDRTMIPSFKEGRFAEGISLGAQAVADVIAKDANVQLAGRVPFAGAEPRHSRAAQILLIVVLLLLIPVIARNPYLLVMLLASGRGGAYRGGGGFGGGGGWGGFGGGMSGGGGASRGW